MTKKGFLENIFKATFGDDVVVKTGCSGQAYMMYVPIGEEKDWRIIPVWIDTLKGGRISLKLKGWGTKVGAQAAAKALYEAAYQISYPVKADCYYSRSNGWLYSGRRWVARLRMNKVW